MNNFMMPPPPGYGYPQQSYGVDAYGNKVQMDTYQPQPQQYQQPVYNGLGSVNFGSLIGSNTTVPMVTEVSDTDGLVVTTNKKKSSTKKKKSSEPVSSAEIVNSTVYADTYGETNNLLRVAIAQTDELAADLKNEFNLIRASRNMKGKYTYLANISAAMSGLISTKVGAIKEINNSIKAANDAEYRRFKDNRAAETQDDSKYIMDMYNAYINTPIGSLPQAAAYQEPKIMDMTLGLNGMVRVDADKDKTDSGFNSYMKNLTPEQNAMLNENDPNIKEVIVYDQSTGKKYFDWRNIATGERVPNMPTKDPMFMEDFTIDPRTRTARNLNLAQTLPVIYENEGAFDNY